MRLFEEPENIRFRFFLFCYTFFIHFIKSSKTGFLHVYILLIRSAKKRVVCTTENSFVFTDSNVSSVGPSSERNTTFILLLKRFSLKLSEVRITQSDVHVYEDEDYCQYILGFYTFLEELHIG